MYPSILLTNSTNEGAESLNSGDRTLPRECIDKLLERTKRRGMGKALKTLLAEAEAKKEIAGGSHMPKPSNSPIDGDTPRRVHSRPATG